MRVFNPLHKNKQPTSLETCPFSYGTTVPPDSFYGRSDQLQRVKHALNAVPAMCLSIVGIRRSGKSSLLRYIHERIETLCARPIIVALINFQDQRYQQPSGLYEGLRRSIEQATGTAPWQRAENDDVWAVADGLSNLKRQGYQLVVIIDEFEQIAARLDVFQDWGNDWRSKASEEQFMLIITSNRPIYEIYRQCGLTSPFGNIFTTLVLGAFETPTWHKLVNDGFTQTHVSLTSSDMVLITRLAGGIPYYTQLAAALLWQYHDHAAVEAEFTFQAHSLLTDLWKSLTRQEQHALRYSIGQTGVPAPRSSVVSSLQRYGVLNQNTEPFSSVLIDIIKDSL